MVRECRHGKTLGIGCIECAKYVAPAKPKADWADEKVRKMFGAETAKLYLDMMAQALRQARAGGMEAAAKIAEGEVLLEIVEPGTETQRQFGARLATEIARLIRHDGESNAT